MNLQDKVIIVTGASSGIGAAIVKNLAEMGAKLVLAARSEDKLQQVADSLTQTETLVVPTDVTVEAQCFALAQTTLDKFGTIDVLINNAGYGPPASLLNTTEEIWDATVDSCLKSVYLMSRAAVSVMLDTGGGTIINISSVAGKYGFGDRTAYCAAKWGVQGFTEALRVELGDQNIRAHTINPGAVATPWWGATNDPQSDEVMARMIQPDEVADAVRYVLTQPERIQIDEVVIKTNGSPWDVA